MPSRKTNTNAITMPEIMRTTLRVLGIAMCDSSYCFYEILADCEYEQGAEKVLLRGAGFSTNRRVSRRFQPLERHCPRSSKYRSRLIPAVRRSFLMMNTGYCGILELPRDAVPPLL